MSFMGSSHENVQQTAAMMNNGNEEQQNNNSNEEQQQQQRTWENSVWEWSTFFSHSIMA